MKKIFLCILLLINVNILSAQIQYIHSQTVDSTIKKSKFDKVILFRVYHTIPDPISFRLEFGYIINQKNDLSIGGGIDIYTGIYKRFIGNLGVVYVKYNYQILKKKNTPFITTAIGYGWSTKPYEDLTHHFTYGYIKERGGANVQMGVGYKLRSKRSAFVISFGIYYNYQHYETHEFRKETSIFITSHITKKDIISDNHNLIIGITFGFR